jgi:hypothetical protein
MGAAGRATAEQFRSGPVAERFLRLCAAAVEGQSMGQLA